MADKLELIQLPEIPPELRDFARQVISSALDSVPPSGSPTFVHTAGIPGGGKTTYASTWVKKHHSFFLLQFDGVMEQIPGYIEEREKAGPATAFANWEIPARSIGYHLLNALVANKRNVCFDHSAATHAHVSLLQRVKEEGYRVEMHHVRCPLEQALLRIALREPILKRHTPRQLVYERQDLLEQLLPVYRQLVDRFIEIDSGNSARAGYEHSAQSVGCLVP